MSKDGDREKPGAVAIRPRTKEPEFKSSAELMEHYATVAARLGRSNTTKRQEKFDPAQYKPTRQQPKVYLTPIRLRVRFFIEDKRDEAARSPQNWDAKKVTAGVTKRLILECALRQGGWPDMVLTRTRIAPYPNIRHEVMYLLRKRYWLSFPAIGRLLKRDHTSVLHGVRKWATDHDLPIPTYADYINSRNKDARLPMQFRQHSMTIRFFHAAGRTEQTKTR